jgi:hypothetical protein
MKICGSKGYRIAEDMNFFCLAFSVDLGMKTVQQQQQQPSLLVPSKLG